MSRDHHIDRKIKSVLRYGKKRQVEIIRLVDANENTVRNHLEDLSNNHKENVIKLEEGGGTYYYSEENGEQIVQPKPLADPTEINDILRLYHSKVEKGNILNKFKSKISNSQLAPFNSEPEDSSIDLMSRFFDKAHRNYYLLENQENLELFFSIFDTLLEPLQDYNSQTEELTRPNAEFELFFMAADYTHNNWKKGKENEDLQELFLQRTDNIQKTVGNSQDIDRVLLTLLVSISAKEGQKAYISMVKSGNYNLDTLMEDAFYLYDCENEIHELLDDLEKAKKQVDEDSAAEIDTLKQKIVDTYNRFSN
jgi:hypothetical protein